MIPSNRWFPSGLADRAQWCANFSTQFAALAASLGFTPADVTAAQKDMQVITVLSPLVGQADAYQEAIREYRIAITENPDNTAHTAFPAPPSAAAPPSVPNGIFKRLSDLRDRVMMAANYSETIGAQLGILSDNPAPPPVIKPVISATAQFSGYKFDLATTKMGMQAFKVLIRRMDSEAWTEAGFGTSSPLTVTVTPHAAGQAERLQVCVQLVDKNQPVGVPSDVVYVTVNP